MTEDGEMMRKKNRSVDKECTGEMVSTASFIFPSLFLCPQDVLVRHPIPKLGLEPSRDI